MLQPRAHTTLKCDPAEEVRKIITIWDMTPCNLADKLLMCQINLLPPSAGQKNHQHLSTTTQNVTIEDDIFIVTSTALHYIKKNPQNHPQTNITGKIMEENMFKYLTLVRKFHINNHIYNIYLR